MNTLIISTFSCTFEEFKNDVTTLFLEEMCKEFVTDYEFVKVNEHKSHLLMNCTDLEKLGTEMQSPFAKEWDKKNNCKDAVYFDQTCCVNITLTNFLLHPLLFLPLVVFLELNNFVKPIFAKYQIQYLKSP